MITTAQTFDHDDYQPMLAAVRDHFAPIADGPLFTTDATDLWPTFLGALPAELRQQHTCHACRHFVERYGGLVAITPTFEAYPAMFGAGPGVYGVALAAVAERVRRAKVTGVFVSSLLHWGTSKTPSTKAPGGAWHHLAVTPAKGQVYAGLVKKAHEVAAERREDYAMLCRALADFDERTIAAALAMVRAEALYRVEKVADRIEWLADLHAKRRTLKGPARDHATWLAVATAPAGWCHVRSSVVGSLLEDLEAGISPEAAGKKFAAKLQPLQYRRPTAPPSDGAIAQAEKVVAALGAAGALDRRFARLDDLRPLWTPAPRRPADASGGVFGHLRAPDHVEMVVKAPPMTWTKFARTVLPDATAMRCQVPASGAFYGLVTAAKADAPPILQWDRDDARNPVSWYTYPHGAPANRWNLRAGSLVPVTAVTLLPFQWPPASCDHHGAGAVFILEGCRETQPAGNALFPEILRSEFHGIRSVIEAYSRRATLGGADEASACGLAIRSTHTPAIEVQVTAPSGIVTAYTIDRWE
jgi:hypothetical protein